MTRFGIIIAVAILTAVVPPCKADNKVAIKSNLLYDALLSPNLGVEFAVAPRWSIDFSGNYNNWKFSHGRRWKHWFVQPEVRYWLKDTRFKGHFLAANLIGGEFNTTLGKGDARRQGWAAGIGAGWGHSWRFGSHWGLETELTVGYARYSYDKYPCAGCGRKIASRDKNYFGPTKAALNLVYYFGRAKKPEKRQEPVIVVPMTPLEPAKVADTMPKFNFALVSVPKSRVLSQSLSGVAKVRFAVSKTSVDPDLHDNTKELNSIVAKLDSVRDDLDMTVTSIKFTGYASPEGSYDNNDRLATERTISLSEYILQKRRLPDNVISRSHVAEDWTGLRKAVAASQLADKDKLLSIIDNGDAPDAKEAALRKHVASWAWLVTEVFPSLRRTEYLIKYEHRYEEQETQTLENVNKAISAGDIKTAAQLLVDIPSSPEADYSRGVVAAMQQRYDEAEAWFKRAESRGITIAADALRQLKAKTGR